MTEEVSICVAIGVGRTTCHVAQNTMQAHRQQSVDLAGEDGAHYSFYTARRREVDYPPLVVDRQIHLSCREAASAMKTVHARTHL